LRYVDIALAAMIGGSAITGILAWNPQDGDAGSHEALLQSHLRDRLLAVVQDKGVLWLLSPLNSVCSYLASLSNSTSGVYAVIGAGSCGSRPVPGSVEASLSMNLYSSEVTLVAWSSA
jgi:hypothetical protein